MNRLDKEMVERGFIDTRTKAQELISKGLVLINGKIVSKASLLVSAEAEIEIKPNEEFKYVSRGGFKLEKALKVFEISVKDKVVMDIGSSTGGFTDCALKNGAKRVVAIDVGTNVMHPSLRDNAKVELHENTNIKGVETNLFDGVEVIVVDVSFISLKKIIEKVASINKEFDMLCLIKPQFECGKEIASKYNGLILNKNIHNEILNNTIKMFNDFGFFVLGLDFSPIKGGDGNVEYITHISNKATKNCKIDIKKLIESAFK